MIRLCPCEEWFAPLLFAFSNLSIDSLHAGQYFLCLLSSAGFSKKNQKSLSGTLSDVSLGLVPDQDRHFDGTYLGANFLQRLSAEDKSLP